jgi:hypothetical protein
MNTLPQQVRQIPQGAVVDRRIEKTVPLITPLALHEELPLSAELAQTVVAGRQAVTDVLNALTTACSLSSARVRCTTPRRPSSTPNASARSPSDSPTVCSW